MAFGVYLSIKLMRSQRRTMRCAEIFTRRVLCLTVDTIDDTASGIEGAKREQIHTGVRDAPRRVHSACYFCREVLARSPTHLY